MTPKYLSFVIFSSITLGIIATALLFGTRHYLVTGDVKTSTNITHIRLGEKIVREILTTAYDKKSSCHYPVKEGCLTASGKIAKEGMAACPRDWKLGQKFYLDGKEYTCQDRYAKYLSPRLDLWMENGARDYGVQEKTIYLVK